MVVSRLASSHLRNHLETTANLVVDGGWSAVLPS